MELCKQKFAVITFSRFLRFFLDSCIRQRSTLVEPTKVRIDRQLCFDEGMSVNVQSY